MSNVIEFPQKFKFMLIPKGAVTDEEHEYLIGRVELLEDLMQSMRDAEVGCLTMLELEEMSDYLSRGYE